MTQELSITPGQQVAVDNPAGGEGNIGAELAKAKPGSLNFASSGTGGSPHLAGELFKLVTQTDVPHIAYKGTVQAMGGLFAGQVQMSFGTVLAPLHQIKSGKLSALAVTTGKRVTALPDAPTMAEQGFAGIETTAWNGVLARARASGIIQRLNGDIVRILSPRKYDSDSTHKARNPPPAPCGVRPVHPCRNRKIGQGCPGCGLDRQLKPHGIYDNNISIKPIMTRMVSWN